MSFPPLSASRFFGSFLIHSLSKYFGLTIFSGSRYRMPHLLMVAGVVWTKLSVSIRSDMQGDRYTDSPFGRLSFWLSSRIELRFSTQTLSIGPSRMIHLRRFETSYENSLNIVVKIPSCQDLSSSLYFPNISSRVIDLGLILPDETPLITRLSFNSWISILLNLIFLSKISINAC